MSDVENEQEEFTFDSSLKKKKKKKKIVTEEELIEHVAEEPASQQQQKEDDEDSVKPEENGEKIEDPAAAEDDDAVMFAEKKKKKKKKFVDFADDVKIDDDTTPAEAPAEAPEGADLGIKKKKKKRPDLADFEKQLMEGGEDGERAEDDMFAAEGQEEEREAKRFKETWLGTDRDYNYQELLGRVFDILRQNNPELAGEKRRYTIVPPSVHREGNKKTIFANVADICKRMHRQPEHVIQYLFAELGTSGSIDGAQRLIIKGRFQQKQIENVLRRYIVEYVTCKTCKSPDTLLTKENRIYFQQCESCGSTRSVSAIKTGFKAQTEKRAVLRRAAAQ